MFALSIIHYKNIWSLNGMLAVHANHLWVMHDVNPQEKKLSQSIFMQKNIFSTLTLNPDCAYFLHPAQQFLYPTQPPLLTSIQS